MNENLKKALQLMLFLTDEQPLSEDIDKINFKKDGWYKKFHWTAKDEEKFIKLFSESLKKEWRGIVDSKPSTVNLRNKIAKEFIMNYSPIIRPLTIQDFTPTVSWAQLDEVMSKDEREAFNKWMFGQTTSLHGVYRWDLERWLNHQPNID